MTKEEIQKNSEHWYNKYKDAEKRITDLENKIADIKANCDLAIEGRDVKIKELEQENAKLESDFRICEKNADTYYDQLTKAKDLIEDMYDKIPSSHSDYYKDVMERARQFIKEIEK